MIPLLVLLIEDDPDDAELIRLELERSGYATTITRIVGAVEMQTALDLHTFDIVIADVSLPQFGAPAALRILQERKLDLPFIVISGVVDETSAVETLSIDALDFVPKKDYRRLVPAVRRALRENEMRAELRSREVRIVSLLSNLQKAYDETLEGWAKAGDLRDHTTGGHSRRVADMTLRLAHAYGISGQATLLNIWRGALLHDVGKIGVPDAILLKAGVLEPDEWEIMKKHPEWGCELLKPIEYLRDALAIPCYHHERWNGSGYPHGIAGTAIPLPARLFAVVDAYDAMCNDRPYRPGWPVEIVLDNIRNTSGEHFDPKVVEVFCEMIEREGNGHET